MSKQGSTDNSGGSHVEAWRDVVGYLGLYQVSDLGRVRSLDRVGTQGQRLKGRTLKQDTNPNTYSMVGLCSDGQWWSVAVHRLVATAFVDRLSTSHQVCHNDGDRRNNCATNL